MLLLCTTFLFGFLLEYERGLALFFWSQVGVEDRNHGSMVEVYEFCR